MSLGGGDKGKDWGCPGRGIPEAQLPAGKEMEGTEAGVAPGGVRCWRVLGGRQAERGGCKAQARELGARPHLVSSSEAWLRQRAGAGQEERPEEGMGQGDGARHMARLEK